MREFRNGKNCTEHYSSLEELRVGWGLKPIEKKRPNDEKVLQEKREKFLGTCKVCKQTLSMIKSTNVLACKNPECRGIKMTSTNEDGSERTWYIPVTRMIDNRGMQIAENLFD